MVARKYTVAATPTQSLDFSPELRIESYTDRKRKLDIEEEQLKLAKIRTETAEKALEDRNRRANTVQVKGPRGSSTSRRPDAAAVINTLYGGGDPVLKGFLQMLTQRDR